MMKSVRYAAKFSKNNVLRLPKLSTPYSSTKVNLFNIVFDNIEGLSHIAKAAPTIEIDILYGARYGACGGLLTFGAHLFDFRDKLLTISGYKHLKTLVHHVVRGCLYGICWPITAPYLYYKHCRSKAIHANDSSATSVPANDAVSSDAVIKNKQSDAPLTSDEELLFDQLLKRKNIAKGSQQESS